MKILLTLFTLCLLCTWTYGQADAQEKAKQNAKENLSEKIQGFTIVAITRETLTTISQEILKKAVFYVLDGAQLSIEQIDSARGIIIAKANITQIAVVKSLEENLQRELSAAEYQAIRYLFPKNIFEYGYAGFTPKGEKIALTIQEAKIKAAKKLAARLAGETIEKSERISNFVMEDENRAAVLQETRLIGCSYSKPQFVGNLVKVQAEITIPLFSHSLKIQLEKLGLKLTQEDYLDLEKFFEYRESDRGEAVIQ